ncbi:MAG TPA: dihydrofolate reductase family protein [Chloroflexia bacterium]|nr:dihydrofolate reductase family protein [Chloroflexia bacterium]
MQIILMAAVTLDGKLARHPAHLSNWTSPEDKKIFRTETRRAGVIIVGHNTYKTFARPLPGRLHIVVTHTPAAYPGIPGAVEFTDAPPAAIVADLAARGYTRAVLVGGAQINALFLAADLVDEIWLTVEPVIFGQGIPLFAGYDFDRRATLLALTPLNRDTFLARYRVIHEGHEDHE